MEFLSPEWCAELVTRCAAAQPVLNDVVLEVQLTGAPRGRGRISVVIEHGRISSCAAERSPEAELKLKASFDDALALVEGTLDPNVAFMTGDMKTDGPTGPLLALLAAWRLPGVDSARSELAAMIGDAEA